MDEDKVKNIVFYILEQAENQEIPIGKTRLIKLLYLLDLENYRLRQMILTGLNWIFYKFGPYTFEIEDFFNKIGIKKEEIYINEVKRFSRLEKEFEEEDIKLDIETKTIIKNLIEEWGTADLNKLLDYIYFDTEPMIKAQTRGEKLDFSSILPAEFYSIKQYKVSKKQGEKIIKKIKDWESSRKGDY